MGLSFSKVFGKLFGKKDVRILMVGLDAAGKTTIVRSHTHPPTTQRTQKSKLIFPAV